MAATKRRASSSMSPTGVATAAIPLDMGSSKRRRIGLQNAFVSRLLPQLPRHGLRRIAPRQNASSVAQHDQPARILGHPAAIDPLVQAHDYARYQFAIGPQSMLQGRSQGPLRFQLSTGTPKGDRCNPLEFGEQVMPEYRMYTVDYNCHRVDAKNIECVDDHEAIQQALRTITSYDVEVWQLDRFVALLPRYEKAPPKSTKHRSRRS